MALVGSLLLLLSRSDAQAPPQPRIVNGTHTQQFPTTGALLVSSGGQLSAYCSGTLIGCNAFLTAAHCVCPDDTTCTPSTAKYRVFLQHGGIFTVDSIVVHPAFLFGERNDVAVVTLSAPVTGISPTAINTSGSPLHGSTGRIAGFGITNGTQDDLGIKRSGGVSTAGCNGQVPEPDHVCWFYDKPLGLPGDNSNTCSGDSGGPLFIDFGGGDVVAGVTSGGLSSSCLPSDLSFDTDVYVNREFITNNADLSNPTCGSISQVGDVNTMVLAAGPAALSRATQKCRKEVAKHSSNYTRGKLRAMQRCLDAIADGSLGGSCPDAANAAKIQLAADRVDPTKIAMKCGPAVIGSSFLGSACAGAVDADDLQACILSVGDTVVAGMLDRQYADDTPAGPLPVVEAKCQKQIGAAMGKYAGGRLRALLSCRNAQDKGRVGSCPDAKTQEKLNRLVAGVQPSIERACANANVAALDAGDAFGGTCAGSTTTAGLAACQIDEHNAQVDDVLALLADVQPVSRSTFVVIPGTDRLRVTLNGHDDGSNDVDLYIRAGTQPTTATFDARSINGGMFEAIEVESPTPGTWHVLAFDVAGTEPNYQVTSTTFQP